MVSSIKISTGKDLDILLRHPSELVALINLAIGNDSEVTEAQKSELYDRGFLNREGLKSSLISTNEKTGKVKSISNHSLTALNKSQIPKDEFQYYEIALAFYKVIQSNLLNLRARTSHLNGATYKKWVDPIRLMVENDKVTKQEFREVWAFLKGHEFWAANIQTTEKLRKQFSTLHSQLKANEQRNTTNEKKQGGARTVSTSYIEGIFNDLQS